ncbi:magnetosome-associated protein MamJ isoform X2 [Teleopsis dalmanni]|uniref:magnetosome-associated protein MamJ isoform X2 n=1 Tax=Teleopsis dalmanni TaxID=139649 RepID=UPI0018CD1D08|nr:magnetosome-associated protein MamJ isoform X2 [Teleopsis dalmanni]
MKFSATLILIVVIVGLAGTGSALPAKKRMVYYQQPAQWYSGPQRMMYVQYVQPSRTHARSTQAAAALVAGESVATSTYLEDGAVAAAGPTVDIVAEEERNEDVLGAAGAHVAHSIAEAYPEESLPQTPVADDVADVATPAVEEPAPVAADEEGVIASNDEAKVPRDYNFDAAAVAETEPEVPEVPVVPVVEVAADLPAPAPIAPVATPARRYLPSKKKVYVELDQSAEGEEVAEDEAENAVAVAQVEEDEEDDETDVAPVPVVPKHPARIPNARRPVAKKPVKPVKAAQGSKPAKPLPAGTFFPIDFGGTNGGAIAIANSFSTGEGGSATSHAIAYGSPEAARARVRPSKLH